VTRFWVRIWLGDVLLISTMLLPLAVLMALGICATRGTSTNQADSVQPPVTFVTAPDPLCADLNEIDQALCSIAVKRQAYGQEHEDGSLSFTPDGAALVRECREDAEGDLSLCLLNVAQLPDGFLPLCPNDLSLATVRCVYLNASDTPMVWPVTA
jgi:hypothetical protein